MPSKLNDIINTINSKLKDLLEDNFEGWTVTTREGYEIVGYTKNEDKIDRQAVTVIVSYIYESLERFVKKYLEKCETHFLAVDVSLQDVSYEIILFSHELFLFVLITNETGLNNVISKKDVFVNAISEALSSIFK